MAGGAGTIRIRKAGLTAAMMAVILSAAAAVCFLAYISRRRIRSAPFLIRRSFSAPVQKIASTSRPTENARPMLPLSFCGTSGKRQRAKRSFRN